jgi:hypothetical protein
MITKRFPSTCAIAMALATLSRVGLAQPAASSSWSISVELDNQQPYTGTSVHLSVKLRNLSPIPLKVMDRNEFADYAVTVKDAGGAAVPYNARAKQLIERHKNGPVFRSDMIEVAPGKDTEAILDLNDLYDPIRPGKYSIRVERVGPLQLVPGSFTKPKGLSSVPVPFQVLP